MSQPASGGSPGTDPATGITDPRTAYGAGPFPGQDQDYPGWTGAMDPVPDHGEGSHVGNHRLDGLTALITGADLGIGRAVAIAYAREGANAVFTYLPEEDGDAAQTVQLIEEAGQRALALPGDLRDEIFCQRLIAQTVNTLRKLDIRVNAVAPGPIRAPLQPPTQPEEKIRNFGQDTPLGRAGQPAELSGAYVYLADPASTYVSGTIIVVTGGRYLA
ncbi:hypothetical protein CVV68_14090 [Arthrobacter livingstonensis]|uniref:NAD(P)-dependent oxidoreductase n=1 Tax=Arthrobacter livingstonensis TaxID=670078 RepID=A0A2V5L4M2_9MICC|nr:SDR family oxidoreductase [Arthrobacter livingstonensis]PYI66421.1 hypothetical protein CVV68_14090 [Arthrobacter livingstonensis]